MNLYPTPFTLVAMGHQPWLTDAADVTERPHERLVLTRRHPRLAVVPAPRAHRRHLRRH